jgi:hypothetical protein
MSNPFLNIGNLDINTESPADYWGNYEVPTAGGQSTIPEGIYLFQVPQPGEDFKPGTTKAKDFCFEINPSVVDGDHKNKKLNYFKASIKKYSNRNGSQAGDLVVGCGLLGKLKPNTPDEWARAAMTLAGKKFRAQVKLEAWDKQQQKNLTLLKNADGTTKTRYVLTSDNVIIHFPEDKEKQEAAEKAAMDNGGRVVWANSKIDRVLPPEEAKAA